MDGVEHLTAKLGRYQHMRVPQRKVAQNSVSLNNNEISMYYELIVRIKGSDYLKISEIRGSHKGAPRHDYPGGKKNANVNNMIIENFIYFYRCLLNLFCENGGGEG